MRYLVLAAVLPGFLILGYVYKLDKIEREPIKLILKLLLFGVLSLIPVYWMEVLGETLIYGGEEYYDYQKSLWQALMENFFVVAISEELCKFIFLKLGSWKNKAFDYRFDAIVYAVSVSMGFAIVENILYVVDNGFLNALMRGILAVPGHAAFAISMGIYYGEAKLLDKRGDKKGRNHSLRMAVFVPMLMHGFYDFCLTYEAWWSFLMFFIFVIIVDVVSLKKIKAYSNEDRAFSEIVTAPLEEKM